MTSSQDKKFEFIKGGPITSPANQHSHDHSHENSHGHTHEAMENAGSYTDRDMPMFRSDWKQRAFTVGIGGPVGSGKTALVLGLCQYLRDKCGICVVTNDIFTKEDWEFLVRNEALDKTRLRAVETGGCPHAAIREDYSMNMAEVRELTVKFQPELVLIESGGDNLAANFSRELADYIIYVIDVAGKPLHAAFEAKQKIGGDKIPRKGGPGVTQSDLLVINKTDLAEAVGASLLVMENDAKLMRQDGPTVFIQAKHNIGIDKVAGHILKACQLQQGLK